MDNGELPKRHAATRNPRAPGHVYELRISDRLQAHDCTRGISNSVGVWANLASLRLGILSMIICLAVGIANIFTFHVVTIIFCAFSM